MEEFYINPERLKHIKPKSNLETWKVFVPIFVTIITVFGSLIGIYIQGSKSASKIEYIVVQINDAIIPRLEKALEDTSTEIKTLRERIAVLEKVNEIRHSKIVPTTFGLSAGTPLDLPTPVVKVLSKPATSVSEKNTKYKFPRILQEKSE